MEPNARGAEAAIRAGTHKITLPLSMSETYSLTNPKAGVVASIATNAAVA